MANECSSDRLASSQSQARRRGRSSGITRGRRQLSAEYSVGDTGPSHRSIRVRNRSQNRASGGGSVQHIGLDGLLSVLGDVQLEPWKSRIGWKPNQLSWGSRNEEIMDRTCPKKTVLSVLTQQLIEFQLVGVEIWVVEVTTNPEIINAMMRCGHLLARAHRSDHPCSCQQVYFCLGHSTCQKQACFRHTRQDPDSAPFQGWCPTRLTASRYALAQIQ